MIWNSLDNVAYLSKWTDFAKVDLDSCSNPLFTSKGLYYYNPKQFEMTPENSNRMKTYNIYLSISKTATSLSETLLVIALIISHLSRWTPISTFLCRNRSCLSLFFFFLAESDLLDAILKFSAVLRMRN